MRQTHNRRDILRPSRARAKHDESLREFQRNVITVFLTAWLALGTVLLIHYWQDLNNIAPYLSKVHVEKAHPSTQPAQQADTLPEWNTRIQRYYDGFPVVPADPSQPQTPQFKWPNTPKHDAWYKSFGFVSQAEAAPHHEEAPTTSRLTPLPADQPEEIHEYETSLKLWKIAQVATPTKHVACTATRQITPSRSVTVRYDAKGRVTMLMEGFDFGLEPHQHYADAILTIDQTPGVETFARRTDKWSTTVDLNKLSLQQLAKGGKLKVTINGYYIEIDLTESAKAATAVAACGAEGQTLTVTRRVAAAKPAGERELF